VRERLEHGSLPPATPLDLDSFSPDGWTDNSITERTDDLIKRIIDIWRVPAGHKSPTTRNTTLSFHSVDLADLLSAGLIAAGQTVVPKQQEFRDRRGQILSDGQIDIDRLVFDSPSALDITSVSALLTVGVFG
jgi:Restriction Enzyme Adenine Methylase Associated